MISIIREDFWSKIIKNDQHYQRGLLIQIIKNDQHYQRGLLIQNNKEWSALSERTFDPNNKEWSALSERTFVQLYYRNVSIMRDQKDFCSTIFENYQPFVQKYGNLTASLMLQRLHVSEYKGDFSFNKDRCLLFSIIREF